MEQPSVREPQPQKVDVRDLTLAQIRLVAERTQNPSALTALKTELNRRSLNYTDNGVDFRNDDEFMATSATVSAAALDLVKSDYS